MRELLEIFGHPERGLFTVVIGGTKGKGSTGFFLSEILRQSGLKAGFYHSPHLESPRERIWINGKPVSEREFRRGLGGIQKTLRGVGAPLVGARGTGGRRQIRGRARRQGRTQGPPLQTQFTYFEILTLLAVLLFKQHRVDIAIFEAGMGGRLDATHTLPAKLVILTPIHFDHEAYLGETLTEIAREKAALLIRGKEAVVAPQLPEVNRVIREFARKKQARLRPPLSQNGLAVGLLGDFQKLNASLALRAATLLRKRFQFPVTGEAMRRGVASNRWPGRMELFKGRPSILLDGAHNPKSIEALCRNLKQLFPRKRKILIFGTNRDKRTERMLPFLGKVFKIGILTRSKTPRAKEVSTLLAEARPYFSTLIPVNDSKEALALARKLARPDDLIVATGSFYLVGEVRRILRALLRGRK